MSEVSNHHRQTLRPPGDNVFLLFMGRISREGRHDEWREALAAVRGQTNQPYAAAKWEAARLCGYEGPQKERELHAAWWASFVAETAAAAVERGDDLDLPPPDSGRTFPPFADIEREFAWALAHELCPIKFGQLRLDIGNDDVFRSPGAGQAPSHFSIQLLAEFLNMANGKLPSEEFLEIIERGRAQK